MTVDDGIERLTFTPAASIRARGEQPLARRFRHPGTPGGDQSSRIEVTLKACWKRDDPERTWARIRPRPRLFRALRMAWIWPR